MEKDMIINQVRLVYDYAYAELEKSIKGHTLIETSTLDQIVAGLWLIVKDTLGESWHLKNKVEFDDNCEDPCEESGNDVPAVEHDDEDHDVPAVEREKIDDDFTAKFDEKTGNLVIKGKGPDYVDVEFVAEKSNKEEK